MKRAFAALLGWMGAVASTLGGLFSWKKKEKNPRNAGHYQGVPQSTAYRGGPMRFVRRGHGSGGKFSLPRPFYGMSRIRAHGFRRHNNKKVRVGWLFGKVGVRP